MSNLDSLPITALEDMELLQRIRQLCDEMQLQTTLLSAGDLSPVPLLRIAIYQNAQGELMPIQLAFSPISSEQLEQNKLLQLSFVYDFSIDERNREALLQFANVANFGLPIGHFVVTGQEVWYRYALSVTDAENLTPVMETVSLFGLTAIQYAEPLQQIALGILSASDAIATHFPQMQELFDTVFHV